MKPHKGTIHNWKAVYYYGDPAKLKELEEETGQKVLGYAISGHPSNHPTLSNWILTSMVIRHCGNEIETLNSRYTLGEPWEQ